jgi:hypothetical protein
MKAMRKKYKLLKDLPNAKVGMVYRLNDAGMDYICTDLISQQSWDVSYPKKYIEENPDWFTEIIETPPAENKEWEIVKFKTKDGNYATKDSPLWRVWSGESKGIISYETCLEQYKIESVRRLSDNITFSIGDELCGLGWDSDEKRKIEKITIINNYPALEYGKGGMRSLMTAKKTPPAETKEEFVWADELVKEFVITYNKIDKLIEGVDPIGKTIKEWKQSKQPSKTKERIKARILPGSTNWANNKYYMAIEIGGWVSEDKLSLIKQAIENIINDDDKNNLK